jgi:hypothetical protein
MTKKLKTLKDLGMFGYESKERTGIYSRGELKEAAKEWIAQITKDEEYAKTHPRGSPIDEYDAQRWNAIKWFIRKFFNIEEK